jgi:hypothetical protein
MVLGDEFHVENVWIVNILPEVTGNLSMTRITSQGTKGRDLLSLDGEAKFNCGHKDL